MDTPLPPAPPTTPFSCAVPAVADATWPLPFGHLNVAHLEGLSSLDFFSLKGCSVFRHSPTYLEPDSYLPHEVTVFCHPHWVGSFRPALDPFCFHYTTPHTVPGTRMLQGVWQGNACTAYPLPQPASCTCLRSVHTFQPCRRESTQQA